MTRPPDPLAVVLARAVAERWSDEQLGITLLGVRIAAEASSRGLSVSQITEEVAKSWILRFAEQEVSKARDVALEKIFRLAAQGEVQRAGAIFRDHMLAGAVDMTNADLADKRRNASARQASKSEKGLAAAKKKRSKLPPGVAAEIERHIANGRSERDAKSIVRKKYGVTSQALGQALKRQASK